ncbi:peptidoglycan DD-metalloendopeptidase family protein [Streptomyces gibsoniae]|uniref:Peptidoglycan DD-metalloendopeptidase family protein n=2 Tax=Streptomyces gibsoniae TaxID=3075529 RepID=A0ABU2UA20_9ACTN|nr:peptidoglycan DD-metalloendopeptidase family protein [Streptomyces sp. DSM 41699]MDT0470088.1 peptidoglycan DD-metalloendopeptidase family protein [Streptomyces sp. DSM 41699]
MRAERHARRWPAALPLLVAVGVATPVARAGPQPSAAWARASDRTDAVMAVTRGAVTPGEVTAGGVTAGGVTAGATGSVRAATRDPGTAVPPVARLWPVGVRPLVLRGWEPPATPYGPGHRGVDLAAPPGDPVRAVAAGRVVFAGRVAGRGVVSVELAGTGSPPLRTTYEPVRASVQEGDTVRPGEVLGVLEPPTAHCAGACLHWGLLRGETYLNPLSLLPPWLLHAGPSRLLRVEGVPLP